MRCRVAGAMLLLTLSLLAGCLGTDPPETGDTADHGPSEDPAAGPDGAGPDDPGDGDGAAGSNGDGGADEAPPGAEPADEPEPAPPGEQRKQRREDIERPGEYAITAEGAGARWDVPAWKRDDTWRWRVLVAGGTQCAAEMEETVTGTTRDGDVPLYALDNRNYECDDATPYRESRLQRTAEHLTRYGADGYIDHELLFPLRDGKKWVYMNSDEALTEAAVAHRPNHVFDLQVVEAWRVTFHYTGRCHSDGDCQEITKQQWYGVDNQHLLKEEIYIDGAAAPAVVVELVESSKATSGGLPSAPGPAP